MIICRQVDDFKIGSAKRTAIDKVIAAIGADVRFVRNKELLNRFNGVYYEQTREYIRIHRESYIDNILAANGCTIPNRDATSTIKPIHPQTVKDLELILGPLAETPKAIALEKRWGFNYRQ